MQKNSNNTLPTKFFDNQIVESDRLLTKQDVADFLQVSIKTIDKKVHLEEIPFLKIGRLVRFERNSILAWARGSNF